MHDIEPHYRWRDLYIASEDELSPFFGRSYSEFEYSLKLYNFYLHPQWDEFGSTTLYCKALFVDYDEGYAIIELIGEWNDTLHDDVMYLKRYVAEPMLEEGINKFVFLCDNLLNFHSGDDDYYAEWMEECAEQDGWIALLNTRPHVQEEISAARLQRYVHVGDRYNEVRWRIARPQALFAAVKTLIQNRMPGIEY